MEFKFKKKGISYIYLWNININLYQILKRCYRLDSSVNWNQYFIYKQLKDKIAYDIDGSIQTVFWNDITFIVLKYDNMDQIA